MPDMGAGRLPREDRMPVRGFLRCRWSAPTAIAHTRPEWLLCSVLLRCGIKNEYTAFLGVLLTTTEDANMAKPAPTPKTLDPTRDPTLVQQAKQGDRAAFQALMQRYQPRVYALACILVHDADQAHDVTQEVFFRAYKSLETFQGAECDASFCAWLRQITVNLCRDQFRQQAAGRRRQRTREALFEPQAQPLWSDPGRALARKELRQHIQ